MAKRLWAKIDCMFFEESASLTAPQQVAFLRLVLHCKRHRSDGHFGRDAIVAERVSSQSLKVLIDKGWVAVNGAEWDIPKYCEWQGSQADLTAAGKAGASARWMQT